MQPHQPLAAVLPLGSTAVVYCDGAFGDADGKTANGLVRHSELYDIVSVVDARFAGRDASDILDGVAPGIPVVGDLAEALALRADLPDYLIWGIAPADGVLTDAHRAVLLDAISRGMHIINGLHELLGDDAEMSAAARLSSVTITDVRRQRLAKDLRLYSGRIRTVTCPRIAVLGTDGSIGKRTTATILVAALRARGLKAVLVGTGQTTIMQGGLYGAAVDAMVPQYRSGEVEHQVVRAFEAENPDVIVIEGQGALSHPAYLSSGAIIRGSRPTGVIVQHAPARLMRDDFPNEPMPSLAHEIALIELFGHTRVIGITLNHEHLSDAQITATIDQYTRDYALPVTDALSRPATELADMVIGSDPRLRAAQTHAANG
ncbi:putative NAD-dependent epimerase/dehydratase family protein [Microcella alkaliphila]|uniref:Putative NAD-dependent epimerase/dehydratase family protein n=1 Tax=Microcella alkaliphila TaxID=279828 RepID=A0A4Q7TTM4_9MICO|nr:DUF1611 domain-containing protein [Microcella alkaliphila]RZT64324.1 putative NAD-dependent epimerase/dehydratase family protein [Microcella alkaliphila]